MSISTVANRGRQALLIILATVFLVLTMGAGSALAAAPKSWLQVDGQGRSAGLFKIQDVRSLALQDDLPGIPLPPFSPFVGYVNSQYPEYCVYRVDLAEGQVITISMSVPATGDFDLYMIDHNNQVVAASTFIGNGVPEAIMYGPFVGGTFYIAIEAYSGTGNYSINYTLSYPPSISSVPVHRFYKPGQGVHFYTSNQSEATYVNNNLSATYKYEGTRFGVFPDRSPDMTPVYRFYNFLNGVHFYTTNWYEAMDVINNAAWTFRYEGVAFNAYSYNFTPGAKPVYRFYNFRDGAHFYTNSEVERQQLQTTGAWTYRYETIAYWAF